MNSVIEEIYKSGKTTLPDGNVRKLSAAISVSEGAAISRIIAENPLIRNTLEVGCANGLSSLHICQALQGRPGAMHTIVDAFQASDWKNAGIGNLNRAGFSNYTLIERLSETALPELLASEKRYQFIFIDGWHTFDHALIDAFFANRLLDVGGFLVLDDADIPPIDKLVSYLTNYPCYERYETVYAYPSNRILHALCRIGTLIPVSANMRYRLPKPLRKVLRKPRMVVFRKVADDKREWNWFRPF
jgi:predicted O-methyltransferase YrrM